MIPKFRFWYEREDYYPDENYMRHVWGIEYIADNKIELNDDYIFNPYTNVAENIYAKTKIYLMQSTGLKDVNGVEIYEGDIVNVTQYAGGHSFGQLPHVVKVSKYGNDLMLDALSKQIYAEEYPLYFSRIKDYKVIGNIWEDGDLLDSE